MIGLIAGDDKTVCQRIREFLLRNGLECPAAHLVSLEVAADRAGRLTPDLVVLLIGQDHEQALAVLRGVNRGAPCYLLAIGPAADPKLILRTMQEGADEYLDEAQIDKELVDAIIRFKSHQSEAPTQQAQQGRLIAVLAPSGGSGASTLAVNLATLLAKNHGTCGLVDLRLVASDLAPLLDLRPHYTLADLGEHIERVDAEMFEQLFAKHASGVHLLAAPREFGQAAQVTDRVVRQALAMARRRFPYVIADLDQALGDEQVEVLWQAEVILLILRLDFLSLRNTKRLMDHLGQLGLGLDRVRLVVNRYGERKQLSVDQAEAALGKKIVDLIPNDPARINGAMNAGSPVVLQRPFAKISRRIAALATSVNGQHKQPKSPRPIS